MASRLGTDLRYAIVMSVLHGGHTHQLDWAAGKASPSGGTRPSSKGGADDDGDDDPHSMRREAKSESARRLAAASSKGGPDDDDDAAASAARFRLLGDLPVLGSQASGSECGVRNGKRCECVRVCCATHGAISRLCFFVTTASRGSHGRLRRSAACQRALGAFQIFRRRRRR